MINDDLTAAAPKQDFPIYTTPLQVNSTKTIFNWRKKFPPLTCKINRPIGNNITEDYSSKPLYKDSHVLSNNPSKQESLQNVKNKSYPASRQKSNLKPSEKQADKWMKINLHQQNVLFSKSWI